MIGNKMVAAVAAVAALALGGCDLWYKDLKGYMEYWTDTVSVESATWKAEPASQRNSSGVHTVATNATVTASLAISNPEGYPLESIVSSAADGPHAVEVSGAAASAVLPLTRVTSSSATSLAVKIDPFSQVPTPASRKLEHTNFTVKISPTRSENAFQAPNPLALTLRYNTPPRKPVEVVESNGQFSWLGSSPWQANNAGKIFWAYPQDKTKSGGGNPSDPDYAAYFSINDGDPKAESDPQLSTGQTLTGSDGTVYNIYQFSSSGGTFTVKAVDGEGVQSSGTKSGENPAAITLNANGGTFGSGGDSITVYKAANSTITGSDLDVPTMSGFYLSGWSTSTSATDSVTFPYTVSSPATLYAQWTANPAGGGSGGGTAPPPVADPNSVQVQPGQSLNDVINTINNDGKSTYTLVLPAGETFSNPYTLDIGSTGKLNLKITSADPSQPAIIDGGGSLVLDVGEFGNVTLENVRITGGEQYTGGGIRVKSGGTLTLEAGTVITGNKATNGGGGGIYVEGGTVIMNGGEITGNNSVQYGGGVYITGGTFTMNGGAISGNTTDYQQNYGVSQGVDVYADGGTFTRNGGTVDDVYIKQP